MKKLLLASFFLIGCGKMEDGKIDINKPMYINILSRSPINSGGGSNSQNYFSDSTTGSNIVNGATVMYSASYGTEGEAGQAWGRLQEQSDGIYFKQEDNTTSQLLLPPGLSFDSSSRGTSLWEFRSYMAMMQKIAKAQYIGAKDDSLYSSTETSQVSFTAETAGISTQYDNALELKLSKQNLGNSTSRLTIYVVKDVGPVAMEFREDGTTDGTFKMYIKR